MKEEFNLSESNMNKRQHGMMRCIYCGKKLRRLSPNYNSTRYNNSNTHAFSDCHRKCAEEWRNQEQKNNG